jgi:hypothetical protein
MLDYIVLATGSDEHEADSGSLARIPLVLVIIFLL